MQIITKGEALEALNNVRRDEREQFSINGNPHQLGPVTIYCVTVWSEDNVDFPEVMFVREKGKVKVHGTA